MPTPPHKQPKWDVDAEVDILLANLLRPWGTGEVDTARHRLREALMYAWYDGQSAGFAGMRDGLETRTNPWLRSVK